MSRPIPFFYRRKALSKRARWIAGLAGEIKHSIYGAEGVSVWMRVADHIIEVELSWESALEIRDALTDIVRDGKASGYHRLSTKHQRRREKSSHEGT